MRLALTGTPGTGKSAIAELLGQKLGWQVVHLGQLTKQKRLYSGWDKGRKCQIVDEKKLKREIEKIKTPNLIIEGHFAHILPADLVIVLRLAPAELKKRLARRGWPGKKIEENVEAEMVGVCATEAKQMNKNVAEIDTTNRPASQITKEIINIINR